MDPRRRADETLARARARGSFVVTPDNATSPMDADNTIRIPREVVQQVDADDEDTQMLPTAGQSLPQPPQWPHPQDAPGWPTEDYEHPAQPNHYQGQQFGSQGNGHYPQY